MLLGSCKGLRGRMQDEGQTRDRAKKVLGLVQGRKLISIIIPCFNEEENVEAAYQAVTRVFESDLTEYDHEIIFLDNYSDDKSFLIMAKIAARDPRVRAVRYARNFGFNRSLLTGYRLAKGDAAIQLDCDLQDPPETFKLFLERWREGHDLVAGERQTRPEGWALHRLRKVYYRALIRLSDDNLLADAGDFRLVDRSILSNLQFINDVDPYVRGLTSYLARNQTTVPYHRNPRAAGTSKFPAVKLMSFALNAFLTHTVLPLRLASIFGMAVALLAGALSIFFVIAKLAFGADWPAGFATIALLMLVSIAINSIFLGILGEYIGRINNQLKSRPTAVILQAVNMEQEHLDKALPLSGGSHIGCWDLGYRSDHNDQPDAERLVSKASPRTRADEVRRDG